MSPSPLARATRLAVIAACVLALAGCVYEPYGYGYYGPAYYGPTVYVHPGWGWGGGWHHHGWR